mgnify:CR=1 FL=1
MVNSEHMDILSSTAESIMGMKNRLNNIVGVVSNGLFANRGADILLLGAESGVKTIVSD